MSRLLLILLFTVMASASFAQTLQVRSGEHGDFTRLVIDIRKGARWTLDNATESYGRVIRFPGQTFSFDISDVYRKIERNRIADVAVLPDNGGLGLKFACDCTAEAYVLDGDMLVVDVSDGVPRPSADPLGSTGRSRRTVAPAFLPGRDTVSVTSPFGVLALDRLNAELSPRPAVTPTQTREPKAAMQAMRDVERDLSEQVARAVSQGVLHLSPDAARTPSGPGTRHSEQETAEAVEVRSPDPRDQTPEATPRATHEDGRILLSGDRCIAEADLALADWAGTAPFDMQLRILRQGLIGEFDRFDSTKVQKLARFYLHFGMGPEAAVLLDVTDADAVLKSLARLLDGQPDPSGTFSGQMHCDTPAALWALLVQNGRRTRGDINNTAILRAFEALPEPLKAYLAPRLVGELLAQGERSTARELLVRQGRSQSRSGAEIELAKAKVDLDSGALDAATTRLTDVARQAPGAVSAQAVESLMEMTAEEGLPTQADIAELASAYSVEFRGTEEGPGLWLAHLRALIASADFDAVFEELKTESSGDDEIDAQAMTEAARGLVSHADDMTFMRIALSPSPGPLTDVPQEIHLSAAERMLSLGLPDAAATLVDRAGADPADRSARVLRARILLAQSRPEDAEIALIGLQGPEVLQLRVEARIMMGDYAYAQGALKDMGDNAGSTDAAWISGDWSVVAETDNAPLADAARLVQMRQSETDPDGAVSLERSQALVGDSETARETLRALLEATRIPVEN